MRSPGAAIRTEGVRQLPRRCSGDLIAAVIFVTSRNLREAYWKSREAPADRREGGQGTVQDVNHAIASLRSSTGVSTLDFDADGNLTLIFNGGTEVNFARLDQFHLELWTAVSGLGAARDAETLRRVLEVNHLGEGTGAGRLALAPGGDGFVLCERIDVAPLSGQQFDDRIVEFLKYATYWNSPEAARQSEGPARAEPHRQTDDFIIRA